MLVLVDGVSLARGGDDVSGEGSVVVRMVLAGPSSCLAPSKGCGVFALLWVCLSTVSPPLVVCVERSIGKTYVSSVWESFLRRVKTGLLSKVCELNIWFRFPLSSSEVLVLCGLIARRARQQQYRRVNPGNSSWDKKLTSTHHLSNHFGCLRNNSAVPTSKKSFSFSTKAMSESSENKASSGLPIDLRGKRAFIAGIADDNGYGWAIAKSLAAAGAEILVGTWVPALNIFETSLRRGKFDQSRVLPDGSLMEIKKVYPLDAVFDNPEDVPEDVKANKRYAGSSNWTVQEAAECVRKDFGSIDILVHSLANGPEVSKPLLETSRKGYLAAISASRGASISLTYIASERIIPGYGGGMSSAKAALESDTRVLAFEAGRKQNIRVNTISAGPLGSRAAKAIGFIDTMIEYSYNNAPIQKTLTADEVGNAAAFLVSPLASAITGATIYVDNGLNSMGVALDSPAVKKKELKSSQSSAIVNLPPVNLSQSSAIDLRLGTQDFLESCMKNLSQDTFVKGFDPSQVKAEDSLDWLEPPTSLKMSPRRFTDRDIELAGADEPDSCLAYVCKEDFEKMQKWQDTRT
ncbi:hypothetical protein Bca4012_009253 [Brassica carinata]